MIYVTHDQIEAMTLADRIVVLEAGKVAQIGAPRDLYENPANLFVAQFIGSPRMNLIDVENATLTGMPDGARHIGIRPEHIAQATDGSAHIEGTVDVLEYLGADTFVVMDCGAAGQVTFRINGDTDLKPGDQFGLRFNDDHLHYFDANGQAFKTS